MFRNIKILFFTFFQRHFMSNSDVSAYFDDIQNTQTLIALKNSQ